MSEPEDGQGGSGGESKRDEKENELRPLWDRERPGLGPTGGRDGTEGEPEGDREEAEALPEEDPAEAAMRQLARLWPDISGEKRQEGGAEGADYGPLGPRRVRAGGGARRRSRRWGEAARRAAIIAAADGKNQPLPSLRAVRESFPLSQRELAQRTGLSRATVAAIEAGGRRPQPSTMRALARVLGVGAGEIAWP